MLFIALHIALHVCILQLNMEVGDQLTEKKKSNLGAHTSAFLASDSLWARRQPAWIERRQAVQNLPHFSFDDNGMHSAGDSDLHARIGRSRKLEYKWSARAHRSIEKVGVQQRPNDQSKENTSEESKFWPTSHVCQLA
jgi:hypothetical protein